MRLTLLDHSGFSLELETAVLIFDYFKDPAGVRPNLVSTEKPVVYFVSHWHPDHYVPVILDQAEAENHFYVIDRETVERNSLDTVIAPERLIVTTVGERISGEAAGLPGITEVAVFGSNDEGVSYIVLTSPEPSMPEKSHLIYHAGDLNDWDWKDEEAPQMQQYYRQELSAMRAFLDGLENVEYFGYGVGAAAGKNNLSEVQPKPVLDLAMIPVDQRLEDRAYSGAEIFVEYIHPRRLAPMHLNGGADLPEKLAKRFSKDPNTRDIEVLQLASPGTDYVF